MGNNCLEGPSLTLNAPLATKVVCFSRLLKCLRSLCGKQCGPRSDCSYRSSLFWVHAVCFYAYIVSNVRQLFAADDFSRRHFQMHFFLGALRVKNILLYVTRKNILLYVTRSIFLTVFLARKDFCCLLINFAKILA